MFNNSVVFLVEGLTPNSIPLPTPHPHPPRLFIRALRTQRAVLRIQLKILNYTQLYTVVMSSVFLFQRTWSNWRKGPGTLGHGPFNYIILISYHFSILNSPNQNGVGASQNLLPQLRTLHAGAEIKSSCWFKTSKDETCGHQNHFRKKTINLFE